MSMILIKEKINSLIEGRFEDAANANQDYANELMKLKSGGLKPKYIDWVLKQFKDGSLKKENNVALDYVLNNLKLFDMYSERQIIKNKDIGKYKNIDDVVSAVLQAEEIIDNKNKKKAVSESEQEVFYNDNDWKIVQPKTAQASCKLGINTKWCISATKSKNHFQNYTESGNVLFYFIFDKKNNKKYAIAVYGEEYDNTIEIYDQEDIEIKPNKFVFMVPTYISQKINEIVGIEVLPVGIVDNTKSYLEKIINNPEMLSDLDPNHEGNIDILFQHGNPEQKLQVAKLILPQSNLLTNYREYFATLRATIDNQEINYLHGLYWIVKKYAPNHKRLLRDVIEKTITDMGLLEVPSIEMTYAYFNNELPKMQEVFNVLFQYPVEEWQHQIDINPVLRGARDETREVLMEIYRTIMNYNHKLETDEEIEQKLNELYDQLSVLRNINFDLEKLISMPDSIKELTESNKYLKTLIESLVRNIING